MRPVRAGWRQALRTEGWERRAPGYSEFPLMKAWLDHMWERPAVRTGRELGQEKRRDLAADKKTQEILFGQRAR